jgi:hypothetical protein
MRCARWVSHKQCTSLNARSSGMTIMFAVWSPTKTTLKGATPIRRLLLLFFLQINKFHQEMIWLHHIHNTAHHYKSFTHKPGSCLCIKKTFFLPHFHIYQTQLSHWNKFPYFSPPKHIILSCVTYIIFCVRFEVVSVDDEDSYFWVVIVSGRVTESSCFEGSIFPQTVWYQ